MSKLRNILAVLVLTSTALADKTPLDVDDLYLYASYSPVIVSPSGDRAVAIHRWIDEQKRDRRSLWVSTGNLSTARPVEPGEPDAEAPMFTPDGKWIIFLSTRPRPAGYTPTPPMPPYSEEAWDFWIVPSTGGTPVPLIGPDKPYGRVLKDGFYANTAFSPDGSKLLFVADARRTSNPALGDIHVHDEDQGEGYTGLNPTRIFIADLADGRCTHVEPITPDDNTWYADPQWTPDGKTLICCANKTADRESVRFSVNRNYDLYAIDLATKQQTVLTTNVGPDVYPRVSPDGKRIVYAMTPRLRGPHADVHNIAVLTLAPKPTTRILFDQHAESADQPPHPAPLGPLPENCWLDNDHITYTAAERISTLKVTLDINTARAEPFSPPPVAGKPKPFGFPTTNSFLRDRITGSSKVIRWRSFDNQIIEGLLTTPPEVVAKPPYKLVVMPHGGPHYRASTSAGFNALVLASHGYAVLEPNFRGSTGYGKAFLDADHGDFGGGDMRDILAGADELIRQGVADAKRQFVHGVSYGGFMSSWIITQTDRFRAAVPQNPVTDLTMMWCLSDLQSWTEYEFGGKPWDKPEAYRAHSPLTFAAKVKTPTLILQSENDRRCPLPMAIAYHQALKAAGVETMLVTYPNEPHGIKQPAHRADALRRTIDWFDRHSQ